MNKDLQELKSKTGTGKNKDMFLSFLFWHTCLPFLVSCAIVVIAKIVRCLEIYEMNARNNLPNKCNIKLKFSIWEFWKVHK